MNTISRLFVALGAAALLIATILGAYGAHALAATLPPARLSAYGTAVDYQFYHGLGLLAVALLAERYPRSRAFRAAGFLLAAGIALFCGALYTSSLGGPAVVGSAAPLGGSVLMLAWLTLAVGACFAGGPRATDSLA